MPVSALNRIPAPGLPVPVAAVFVTIPGLLKVATQVETIEVVEINLAERKPAQGRPGGTIHTDANRPVVEVGPLFLRYGFSAKG